MKIEFPKNEVVKLQYINPETQEPSYIVTREFVDFGQYILYKVQKSGKLKQLRKEDSACFPEIIN